MIAIKARRLPTETGAPVQWVGVIDVYMGCERYLWGKSSGIARLCEKDALADAAIMKKNLEEGEHV